LAEDEASIGAISIWANTAVSALSGGTTTMTMPGTTTAGSFDRVADGGRGVAAQRHRPRGGVDAGSSNDVPPPNDAAHAAVAAGYAPLNHILGGLHRERLSRRSANRPPSGGESSLRSVGSHDGARGIGGGASHRSLPGNLHVANNNNNNSNGGFSGGAAAPSWNTGRRTPSSADEDAEMEEADDDAAVASAARASSSSSSSIAAVGGCFDGSLVGSVAAGFCGSRSGVGGGSGFGNLGRASGGGTASVGSAAAVAPGDDATPGWKRRVVHLPSHSSLY